jgi:hypothetical protein
MKTFINILGSLTGKCYVRACSKYDKQNRINYQRNATDVRHRRFVKGEGLAPIHYQWTMTTTIVRTEKNSAMIRWHHIKLQQPYLSSLLSVQQQSRQRLVKIVLQQLEQLSVTSGLRSENIKTKK